MKEGRSELADSTLSKHVDPDNGQENCCRQRAVDGAVRHEPLDLRN